MRKFIKAGLIILAAVIGILALFFISLNLPFSQRFLTKKVNRVFSQSGLPIQIQNINTIMPARIHLQGVGIIGPEGDTLIYAGDLRAGYVLTGFLHRKVILKKLDISQLGIKLSRDTDAADYDIAELFSVGEVVQVSDTGNKSKSWEISVSEAGLSRISFLMTDIPTGTRIVQDVPELRITGLSIALQDETIFLQSAEIRGAEGGFSIIAHDPVLEEDAGGTSWNIGFGDLSFNDLRFTFDNSIDSLRLDIVIGEGAIGANHMDLRENEIEFQNIFLSNASARILTGNSSKESPGTEKVPRESFPWELLVRTIDFENAEVILGPYHEPVAVSTESEFTITDLDLSLSEMQLSLARTGVVIGKMNFDLSNGFSLVKMEGSLDSDSDSVRFDLALETGNSILNMEGVAGEDIFQLINEPADIGQAKFAIRKTSFSLRDILYYQADLSKNEAFMILAREPVQVMGDFNLQDSRVNIPAIRFTQGRNFDISLSGTVDHPFPPQKPLLELQIGIPKIGKSWLDELLAGLGIEDHIPQYNSLSLEGTLSNLLESPDFTLQLKSDVGNIDVAGSLNLKDESYALNSSFNRLVIGEMLSIQDLGSLSGSGNIKGSGFSLKTLSANLMVEVDSFGYHGHNYILTNIEGSMKPDVYEFDIRSDDPSLKWNLNAQFYPADSVFAVAATTHFFTQLNDLNLFKDTLSLEGSITGTFKKRAHSIESEVSVSDLKLTTPLNEAEVTYLNAFFITDSLETSLGGESEFFHAEAMINRPIGELGSLMDNYRNYILSFIDPLHEDATHRVSYLSDMTITSNIEYHDALKIFLPDTSLKFNTLDFSLVHKGSDQRVNYHLKGNRLEYKMLKSEDLIADLIDSAGILNLEVAAMNNFINTTPTNKLLLTSTFSEWNSLTNLTLINKSDEILYGFEISSGVDLDSNQIVLKVPSKQMILNKKNWYLETPDLLTVDLASKKLYPDLRMHTDSSQLHLYTRVENEMLQYSFELSNVALSSLLVNNVVPGNPLGSISGSVNYQVNEDAGIYFNTDFKINEASWSDLKFGEIGVNGNLRSSSPGNYAMDFSARLDSSKIVMKGEVKDSITRNIRSNFTSVPLNTFQPFVREYLSDLKGTISGNFNISSAGHKEVYSGGIHANNAQVRVNPLNARFKIPEDSLIFKEKRLLFNHFRILDSLNNELLVDGYVDFSDRNDITTDLGISSSRLQVMNTGEEANASLYGNAFIDSRLSVRGAIESPIIKGNIQLSAGSDLYYRHMEDLSLSESERIVSFVDLSDKELPELDASKERPRSIYESSIETLVKIDPSTRIHFNLSKRIYNINLMIKGGASLNYQMLKNNQVTLAGIYEISEGTAELKMVGWPSKSFRIAEGGYIRWDGMVEDPELKFEASSRVRSSYTNPVDGKQREVDFNVVLQLSNRLSMLDVLFTINTTDQYLMSIINTLSPEEKMRQAITILLFENIDLPGISTTTSYMTEQVNQLVASQLNQLTKTTIKGIDISFGLDSYVKATQSGGEQTKTSLSYEVRKGLLNERAQIELSGRLNDVYNQPGASDLSINNISFEYRIDSAATTFLKVYNEHSYEDVFEGEVISTGIGVTYRKRYRFFREIWKRDPENRKTRNRQK